MGSLYSETPSWLHRWRAGSKLLALVLLGLALVLVQHLLGLAALAAGVALLLASLGRALYPVRRLLWLVLVTALLLTGFHALLGQWQLGAAASLRLATASGLGAALTVSTRSSDLVALLEWLLQPLRFVGVQPQRLSLQLGLMLRFTEHFFVQWGKLADAYRLRTGRSGGWRLLAPLAIHMLQTARRVADALWLRLG
ncbi:MAG: energy-coupling factor transporter transmembrane protein EcfT [Comamonas sp.]|nr:energy-coupling factor transporter transmembrane protein EcfT [Comamonas sp.]